MSNEDMLKKIFNNKDGISNYSISIFKLDCRIDRSLKSNF